MNFRILRNTKITMEPLLCTVLRVLYKEHRILEKLDGDEKRREWGASKRIFLKIAWQSIEGKTRQKHSRLKAAIPFHRFPNRFEIMSGY